MTSLSWDDTKNHMSNDQTAFDPKARQPLPIVRDLPDLAHMAPAVAHELEQLALYLDKTVACDAMVQEEVSRHSIGRNDMNASLAQRLGAALGALEVAARNVRHQAKLLKEAK